MVPRSDLSAAQHRPGERVLKRAPLGPTTVFISLGRAISHWHRHGGRCHIFRYGDFFGGVLFGGYFLSIIFGRLRMGNATVLFYFIVWTFSLGWYTWFVIAGRAIRRLCPRNPVPRALR